MVNTARCKECNYAGPLCQFRPFKDEKILICPECESTVVRVYRNVPMCTGCGVDPSLPPSNLCDICEGLLKESMAKGRIKPLR